MLHIEGDELFNRFQKIVHIQDPFEKMHMLQELADDGYGAAQEMIGQVYFNGKLVPKDYDKAMHYFKLSAEQGNAHSQNMVWQIMNLTITTGNYNENSEGFQYLLKSARQKDLSSALYAAWGYTYGNYKMMDVNIWTITINYKEALSLLQLVSEELKGVEDESAEKKLYDYIKEEIQKQAPDLDVKKDISESKEKESYFALAEKVRDVQKKIELLEKGVNKREAKCMLALGDIYAGVNADNKDLVKAEKYYRMAIRYNLLCYVPFAKFLLQQDENSKEALEWLCKAVKESCDKYIAFEEMENLTSIQREQLNEKLRPYKDELLRKHKNSGEEYQFLGLCFIYGVGAEKDKAKGKVFLQGAEAMLDLNSYMLLRMPEMKYNENMKKEIFDNCVFEKFSKKTLKKKMHLLKCKKLKRELCRG